MEPNEDEEPSPWRMALQDAFVHLLHNYGRFTVESAAEMCRMLDELAALPFPESYKRFKAMRPNVGAHWSKVPLPLIKAALRPRKDATPIEEVDFAHFKLAVLRIPLTLCELAWEKIRKPPPKPPASLPH